MKTILLPSTRLLYHFCLLWIVLLFANARTHAWANNAYQQATTPTIELVDPPQTITATNGGEQTQFYVIYFNDIPKFQSAFITVTDPSGEFTISADSVNFSQVLEIKSNVDGSFPETVQIHVKYKPSGSGEHMATISHSTPGAETQNFNVTGVTIIPLPVQLRSFKANKSQSSVVLYWKAAADEDLSHFEIEASANPGNGFKKIGTIAINLKNTKLETDYTFVHNTANKSNWQYFRLAQVYFNHSTLYSKIIAVNVELITENTTAVSPNPFSTTSQLSISAVEAGKVKVVMHNLKGAEVFNGSYDVIGGENKLDLNAMQEQPAGVYILTSELHGVVNKLKLVKL
ncbi:T9SS type A sorting domain-containing protein [Pontibacter vulgaris]|uniref:T9SS type A sorting domain-containing protein n=1 Tax=Pontibacter vulgaris TaxID=2905679 RepID=UPI001FA6DB4B|nr:T9SS type A sorting domain-containing protein [Pontibacter vulgaris]